VAEADAVGATGRRAVVADFSDNPGGGGQGDATALLRAVLGIAGPPVAVASMWDPATVEQAAQAGIGAYVDVRLGGSLPEFGGPPIEARALVLGLGDGAFQCEGPIARGKTIDLGRIATLRIGRADIIVASNRFQVTDRNHFRVGGLDPLGYPVLVVKSLQHFRAAFEPIADQILFADSGAVVSRDFARFPYRQVRRPIWPLDELSEEPLR
jgi:microcystin degradation protein MlrC